MKDTASMIVAKLHAPSADVADDDGMDSGAGLHAASSELLRAVHAHDAAAVAMALQSAFQILDAEPHEEGPHTEE